MPSPQEDNALCPYHQESEGTGIPSEKSPKFPSGSLPIPVWDRLRVRTGQFGWKRNVKLWGREGCCLVDSGLEPGRFYLF